MYNRTHQLSATCIIRHIPHRDKAIAETREYHRDIAWTKVSWHSKNGTSHHFLRASECLIVQVACISSCVVSVIELFSLFSHIEAEKNSSISGTTQCMNTKFAPVCC